MSPPQMLLEQGRDARRDRAWLTSATTIALRRTSMWTAMECRLRFRSMSSTEGRRAGPAAAGPRFRSATARHYTLMEPELIGLQDLVLEQVGSRSLHPPENSSTPDLATPVGLWIRVGESRAETVSGLEGASGRPSERCLRVQSAHERLDLLRL